RNFKPASDFVLTFSAPRSQEMFSAVYGEKNEQPYMLLGYQPRVDSGAQQKTQIGRNILFVAETSGSRSKQDLDAQRQVIEAMVAALDSNDRVAIAAADVALEPLHEGWLPLHAAGIDTAFTALKNRVPLGAFELSVCVHESAK